MHPSVILETAFSLLHIVHILSFVASHDSHSSWHETQEVTELRGWFEGIFPLQEHPDPVIFGEAPLLMQVTQEVEFLQVWHSSLQE